ncbi:glycosyl hydrolase [Flavilitoribacter nigricans DSM 23189 = NBRC 102662]|uniref:Glycosyl hydrolase n=2 Tax=Flavilitoribacter TaxID=2762562 RepID=A0A2D0NAP7_FLAN2|nr:glycosyl hydrolase [Flavilitoribacter nigricans DSM 23189 = NBRC 102662]
MLGLIALLAVTPLFGQKKQKKAEAEPMKPAIQTDHYQALHWRNIGPFRGGRSNAVSGVVGNENLYYTGYTGGGVWKTEDAGLSWVNISDGFFKTGSVGDIAVSESDPNVIYVGMGEHAVRGVMTSAGDGVYRSTDAGKTWTHLGLDKTRHISDVVIHPDDPNTVWVAAQGALHGPNPERGIYKSTDGGQTWKKTLYVDENTGASSLSLDMTNPRILYAATWQHRRYPWTVESGGPGSSLYKSVDGGETWEKIVSGLPKDLGKIGVSVSRANPNRVYAIVETEKAKSGLYRSDNGGKSWRMLSTDQYLSARSWYYMEVFADPINEDIVYVLNAPMMRSIDGGNTFSRVSVGHGDTHDLWINPDNNRNMILGDDGGGEITFNTGASWSTLNNQPTAQFYRVNVDNQFPYKVYGGQQDNSSVVISSRNNGRGLTESDWFSGPGCESAYIAFDPDNPVLLYGGCYQGIIEVLDIRTQESKDIQEYPSMNFAEEPKDLKYRFNWNAPIIASPHDPSVIYHTANVVFRTTDGGINWEVISPDLTRNDTTKQVAGGGPFTNEGAGGENYNTIYYLIESPLERGVLYAGSDCGLVHVTRDNGENWQNITPPDLPESTVHSIEVSPHTAGTAYVSANRFKFNDFKSYTYKTTDYGQNWTLINKGLDEDDYLRVIREDLEKPGLLYGGAEHGFYVSYDGGAEWSRLQLNLPVVPITDLKIHDNDLVAATQGRAFWILDDLAAIQGKPEGSEMVLYEPKPTVRMSGFSPRAGGSMPPGIGQNPMAGVILTYYLPEKPDTTLHLEIVDAAGKVVRAYSSEKDSTFKSYPGGPPAPEVIPAKAGLNRFAWDFRSEVMPDVTDVFIFGDYRGRRLAPGQYTARLKMGDKTVEQPVSLLADPRQTTVGDAAAWKEQQDLMQYTADKIGEIHQGVNIVRKVRDQIKAYNKNLAEQESAKAVVEKGKDLIKMIDEWESRIVETRQKNTQDVINWPSKLNASYFYLRGSIDAYEPQVTQGVKDRLQDLDERWEKEKKALNNILETEIPAYNRLFREQNIPALVYEK